MKAEEISKENKRVIQLWQEFSDQVRNYILKRVSDPMVAEDLLQEVFIKVHSAIDSMDTIVQLEGWIYTIARNTIIDYYRTRKVHSELDAIKVTEDKLSVEEPAARLTPSIRSMVSELPEHYRRAIELTEFEGMTQKEMGEELGLSLSGAKSRVQRARGQLKQMLLECCHFTLDSRGGIVDYHPRCHCCAEQK